MVLISSQSKNNSEQLRQDIKQTFLDGIKPKSDFKIGVEIEKLPVKKNTNEAVSYYDKNGIKDFLEVFSSHENWEKIYTEGELLGLKKDGAAITLEPGSQFEVALSPSEDIHKSAKFLEHYHKVSAEIASSMDFSWLGYGIQPVSTFGSIDVIPKSRYELMGEYLPTKGSTPLVMMRETAGLQVALDYSSEADAINKLRLGIALAPIISAMFVNSPIRAGLNSGYKSYRAHSWLSTDNDRCGLISQKLFDKDYEFTFDDYIDKVFDIPMIFVERNGKPIPIKGMTFREYLQNGYDALKPTLADWELHSSLFFPDVRMKNFIEFRNADCQNTPLSLALMALYKGLFYDEQAMQDAMSLIDDISWLELNMLRSVTPRLGLDAKVKDVSVASYAIRLIEIARESLIVQGKGEEVYLNVLNDYTFKGKTPADVLLDECGTNINKLVEYTRIN